MGFLRLVSEGRESRVGLLANRSPGIKGDQSHGPLMWPKGTSLPSREVLITLLWVIRVEERKLLVPEKKPVFSPSSRPGSNVFREKASTNQIIVSSAGGKWAKRAKRTVYVKVNRGGKQGSAWFVKADQKHHEHPFQ